MVRAERSDLASILAIKSIVILQVHPKGILLNTTSGKAAIERLSKHTPSYVQPVGRKVCKSKSWKHLMPLLPCSSESLGSRLYPQGLSHAARTVDCFEAS